MSKILSKIGNLRKKRIAGTKKNRWIKSKIGSVLKSTMQRKRVWLHETILPDCSIRVSRYFCWKKCKQGAKYNKKNTNSCFCDTKYCSVLIIRRIFGTRIAQLIKSLKDQPILLGRTYIYLKLHYIPLHTQENFK